METRVSQVRPFKRLTLSRKPRLSRSLTGPAPSGEPDAGCHASADTIPPMREIARRIAHGAPSVCTVIAINLAHAQSVQAKTSQSLQISQPFFACHRSKQRGRVRILRDKGIAHIAADDKSPRSDAGPKPGQNIGSASASPQPIQRVQDRLKNSKPALSRQTAPSGVPSRHYGTALVGQQHRQTIRHHHSACESWLVGDAAVRHAALVRRIGQADGLHSMHLPQENWSHAHHLLQRGSIGSNGSGAVADMVTQIQRIKRRSGTASHARRAQCTHLRRCRPLRYKPIHQPCKPFHHSLTACLAVCAERHTAVFLTSASTASFHAFQRG